MHRDRCVPRPRGAGSATAACAARHSVADLADRDVGESLGFACKSEKSDIVKDVRGSESNCEQDSRKM